MEQPAPQNPDQYFSSVPPEMMLMGWRVAQLPAILMTAWWNQWMQGCMAAMPHHHFHHFHEPHDQLVVPEPIEKKGEHALFA